VLYSKPTQKHLFGALTMAAAMEQPLQPDLVKSGTDDDDNSSVGGAQEKAMEYLLRYETMVRQQVRLPKQAFSLCR
jgi:hypothetical protein